MCSRCTMMVLLASVLTLWLGQASGADGAEAAARKPRTTVTNDIVAATLCPVDGKAKLLVLRRQQIEPEGDPNDPGHPWAIIFLLSAELYPVVQGGFDPNREAVIWQDWYYVPNQIYQGHDRFNFVTDPMTGKPYLLWAHALQGLGSLSVNELDPRATLIPAEVSFNNGRMDGLPDHPEDLVHIRYRWVVTHIDSVAGAYTSGPGINPSLMLYPKMGHITHRFEIPAMRLDLTAKKLYYSDGREVKLDEHHEPMNNPPAAGTQGPQGGQ